MFESNTNALILSAISFGFASFVYIFYGPKQTSKTSKSKNAINGLYNFGNQCFINSILQSLAACKSMISWLKYAYVLHNQQNNNLIHQVLNTLNVLNNGEEVCAESTYSPIDVLNALRAHKWNISNEEQDAFELLNVLTSTLELELYSSLPVYSLRDALLIEELMSSVSPEKSPTIRTRGSNLNSSVDNRIPKSLPTRGMLASQLYCRKCCYKYPLHLDTFDTISLVMPNNIFGVPLQLQDCLNKFVSNEIIHEVRCETCSKLTNTSNPESNNKSAFIKKLNFAKLPQLLCLHIQRLVWLNNGQPLKRCEYITFPEYLDMDSYVYKSKKSKSSDLSSSSSNTIGLIGGASTPVKKLSRPTDLALGSQIPLVSNYGLNGGQQSLTAKYKYKLCSVIVHLGDASSGHFICYRRGTEKHNQLKWYYTSDTNVFEVSLSEVLNSSAYMLFYERIKNNL